MFRDFLKCLLLLACLVPLGCDEATSSLPDSQPKGAATDSSDLLVGGWVRVDSAKAQVQTMRLGEDRLGRLADWDSGARASQVRFTWSLQSGLLVRSVDSGSPKLTSTIWRLKGDSLIIGPGGAQKWTRALEPETKARAVSIGLSTRPVVDTGKGGPTDTSSSRMVVPDAAELSKLWQFLDTASIGEWIVFMDLRGPIAKGYYMLTQDTVLKCDTIGPWMVSAGGELALGDADRGQIVLVRNDTLFDGNDSTPMMRVVSALPNLPIVGDGESEYEPPVDSVASCLPNGREPRMLGTWVKPGSGEELSMDFRADGIVLVELSLEGQQTSLFMEWGTKADSVFLSSDAVEACEPGGKFTIRGDTLWLEHEDGDEIWVRPSAVEDTTSAPDTTILVCPGMGVLPELLGAWSMVTSDPELSGVTFVLDFGTDGTLKTIATFPPESGLEGEVQNGTWMAGDGRIILLDSNASSPGVCEDAMSYTLVEGLLTIDGLTFQRDTAP